MSRKKKKSQRRGKQMLRNSSQTNAPVSRPAAPRSAVSRLAPQVEFNPDYTYIIKDLKRIGVLAGSFLVILIGLSFFL